MGQSTNSISIIIAAYRRPEVLTQVLHALSYQTVAPAEVIVVDNGTIPPLNASIDQTEVRLPIIWLTLQRPNARAAARNAGIARATGRIALFLDADMLATPTLLEHHRRSHHESIGPTVVVGRRFRSRIDDRLTVASAQALTWRSGSLPTDTALCDDRDAYFSSIGWELANSDGPWRAAFTCNLSVSTDAIKALGGFDEDFDGAYGYEDIDVAYRLYKAGARFVLATQAVAFHIEHPPFSGNRHNEEKERNIKLFRSKHPEVWVSW